LDNFISVVVLRFW